MSTWSELPEHAKEHRKASVKRFRQNRKLRLLEHKGGMKCQCCGYNKPIPDVYEFHHTDPDQKDPNWTKMISNNWRLESMIEEIEKCVVLCANCHREEHASQR
jgi:hypothetical protein